MIQIGDRLARAAIGATLAFAAAIPAAAQPSQAQATAIRQNCRSDYMAHCSSVPPGGAESLACLQQHAAKASPACQQALRAASGVPKPASAAAPASKAASTPAAPAANAASTSAAGSASSGAESWPHTITTERGSAVVFEPQVLSWPDRRTLNTRIALGLTPRGAKGPTLGTIEVAWTTDSDVAARTVTLTAPKITSVNFPSATPEQLQHFEQSIKIALDAMSGKEVPLDTVLLSLGDGETVPQAEVKNDPPAIFYSSRSASLLVFDGEPVLAPITGSSLQVVVNTNWDVFVDPADNTWYWLNNGAWLKATDFKGKWSPAGFLPLAFRKLPADANFAAVKKAIPGKRLTARDLPTIFVSTVPAEIIVTAGTPKLVAIPGTSLKYVSNTDANLFVDSNTRRFYYLIAGRWFSAASLDGPWTFATSNLPADFARIAPSSPRGSVLVSVPGTPQAKLAILQAQAPTQGTLARNSAKVEVIYSGPPKFVPITGTTMRYAVNTTYDVIQVTDKYYTCYQAAWFVSSTPNGAWALADNLPTVIYTIPSSSPMYRCTYVKVYATTPTTVTFGYTAGYTMSYVSSGVIVYGTGYYYPPVIWPAPIPIYYPYPYTWSGATWYNPNTGAWARGGTVYGPYGGAVSGGTAYNPNTGAWAHGGAVYGPNGGAGAWSAYNPSTGSYAHGSASWGTNSGTANASWYNARTGISGTTNQNYNEYGNWGSSTFSGANKTVNTQHQTNAQGSAGSFKSSTGAEGAGVKGANGNSAGIAKGSGGNVYAGANGNVYRHTSDGWSKWSDGSWNPVTPPTNANQGSRQNNLSGETRQSGTSQGNLSGATRQTSATENNLSGATAGSSSQKRSANANQRGTGATSGGGRLGQGMFQSSEFEQLDRDRMARTQGAERQQRMGGGRLGGGEGGGRFRR
ncbi:MAG TPA: hypothetical protein VKV24_01750 [Casimicrobiaceae bacterium]|nr:hypothetical protein [Casimicrobiaceae bacterium]